ncbi:TPA: hypothetical protein DEO28_01545 [Candidatus Dependentiae bacterium]|nr:MAG: hypothetical protein UR14_C0003G0156 [candidate division TM6 bacterium GW2011_GWE2_31_21]KKP53680.1 MAG: hypothetical protein UR43_C0003G0001 [candidate division TM6 bacterium GW2011_GWF2_33_332]HBS48568.1 hypothetical protein [Candidatus Dependentiae bacterium]HBZ73183.1 hypothetical protein [Candidatus Dependentiae bacterium]
MILYYEWLSYLKKEIKRKFNIENPTFYANKKLVKEEEELHQFVKENFIMGSTCVKYRYLEGNNFELKGFYPDPPEKLVDKIINDFLDSLEKSNLVKKFELGYTVINYYEALYNNAELKETLDIAGSVYDESEIKIELTWLISRGHSIITFFKDPTITDTDITYHLKVELDTIENMLKSGYLTLEYL